MALTIDELEIKVNADAKQATGGIDSLAKSLEKLKTITSGISSTASELQKFSNAMSNLSKVNDIKIKITGLDKLSKVGISDETVSNLERASRALKTFNGVPKISLLPIANGIVALDNATKGLDATRLSQFATQISGVATALQPLSELGKSDLGSYFNQLKKIPEIINALDNETLERFSVTVQKVTETLRPLAAEAEKLAPVFEKLPSSVKGAIKANEQLERSNRKLASSSNGLEKALKRVVRQFASFFTLRKIFRFLSDCLEISNDYAETLNLFTVALGDASEEMKAYAKTVETVMGIDSAEWMNNQAVFMQTLTGFGVAEDEAASMSKTLTQLGYDIASLWNADTDLVMSRLESAMTGQIKGMKNYGYNVSVAALKETALALGIEKSVSAMTEAEKAQLRFITIMRNAEGTKHDMAKTLLSPANAMRVYASTLTRLKRALGDIISVLLTRFLPYMQATVELLTELANHIAVSFGFEVEEFPSSVVDSVGDLTGELEDGQEAAKELKKQLMGFDELNILKSGDNGDGITNSLGIDMKSYDYNFLADANRDKIEQIKQDITDIANRLKDIKEYAGIIAITIAGWNLGKFLADLWTANVRATTLQQKLALLGNKTLITIGVVLSIAGLALEIKGIIDAIKTELDNENFVEIIGGGGSLIAGAAMIGKYFGTALIGGAVGGIIAGVGMLFTGLWDAIKNGLDWLSGVLIPTGSTLIGTGIGVLIGSAAGPWGALIGLIVGLLVDGIILIVQHWEEVKKFFTETIPEWWNGFCEWLNGVPESLKTWASGLGEKISKFFDDLWQPIRDYDWTSLGYDVGQWFGNVWKSVCEFVTVSIPNWFSGIWKSIKSAFKQFFTEILPNFFTETLPQVWEKIVEFCKGVPQKIAEAFKAGWNWYVDIGTAIWTGIWEGLCSIWTAITDFVSGFVQGFKDALGIHSPSTVFAEIGGYLIEGLFGGMLEWLGDIGQWCKTHIIDPFKRAMDGALTFVANIKNDATTWWNNVKTWWGEKVGAVSSFITNVKNDASNWWGNVKNWWNEKVGSVASFTTNVKNNASTWWSNVKTWWNNQASGGISLTVKLKEGWTSISAWIKEKVGSISSELKIKLPHINVTWQDAGFMGLQYPKFSVSYYANGGFPSMGEMFIARESGPEMVGRIGNKTAVANNSQIINGITSGVYRAMMMAQADGSSNNGGTARIIVQIGDRAVGEAAVEYINGEIRQTGTNPINY